MRSTILRNLGCLALVSGILILQWLGFDFWGSHKRRIGDATMSALGLGFDEMLAIHPDRDSNLAAKELERLGAALGLDLVPVLDPRPVLETDFPADELGEWVETLADDSHEPLPLAVVEFLALHDETLDSVFEMILTAGPPRWYVRLSEGHAAVIPELGAHLRLCRLLLARAVAAFHDGDLREMERSLESHWILTEAFSLRPELISQLIALAEVRELMGILRGVPFESVNWHDRLRSLDLPARWEIGLREMSWNARWFGDEFGILPRPYFRACAAEAVAEHADTIRVVRDTGFCRISTEGFARPTSFSNWNQVGKIIVGDNVLDETTRRFARAALDLEMTRQILTARSLSRRTEELTIETVSGDCPSWSWRRELRPDGSFSLEWLGPEPIMITPQKLRFSLSFDGR